MSMDTERRFLTRRVLDLLFIAQLCLFAAICTIVVVFTIETAARVAQVREQQVAFAIEQNAAIQEQNVAQICNQYDMIVAVKLIGERLNILRTDDIALPDIEGLECP